MIAPAVNEWRWDYHTELLWEALGETLQMVVITLGVGGVLGLLAGLTLYSTRAGGLFENRYVYTILNIVVNTIRPIPFIIFLTAIRPLTLVVMGTSIGVKGAVLPMIIMCTMATSRLVEQNLVATDPGIIEAGRAMGASRTHVLLRIVMPEALGPLVLAYAFLFVAVVDMSAMAGAIGAGGLGNFAIVYGYNRFNDLVTWVAVAVLVVLVQVVQYFANFLAVRVLRRS